MALPESGPISLSQIVEEFSPGRERPWKLSEYYRGGRYVPIIPFTLGIPARGQEISLSDFHGKENRVRLNPRFIPNDKPYDGTTTATAMFEYENVRPGDDVRVVYSSIAFSSPDLGSQTVTARGLSLEGADAENYFLDENITQFSSRATITGIQLRLPWRSHEPGTPADGRRLNGYIRQLPGTDYLYNGASIERLGDVIGGVGIILTRLDLAAPRLVNNVFYNGVNILREDRAGTHENFILTSRRSTEPHTFVDDGSGHFTVIIS